MRFCQLFISNSSLELLKSPQICKVLVVLSEVPTRFAHILQLGSDRAAGFFPQQVLERIVCLPSLFTSHDQTTIESEMKLVMKTTHLSRDSSIPHICHGYTGHTRGEKTAMWRNFKFLNICRGEKSGISPHSSCGDNQDFST